jgi:hypothetical protein
VSTAVLIGPAGRSAEVLSEDEHQTLRMCLHILRTASKDVNGFVTMERRLLDLVVRMARQGGRLRQDQVAEEISNHLQETDQADQVAGYLHDGSEIHPLESEPEVDALLLFLSTLRHGGWLPQFITAQCRDLAASSQYPTPVATMQSLARSMEDFENQLKAAREVYQRHPALFAPDPTADTAQEPPAGIPSASD